MLQNCCNSKPCISSQSNTRKFTPTAQRDDVRWCDQESQGSSVTSSIRSVAAMNGVYYSGPLPYSAVRLSIGITASSALLLLLWRWPLLE